LEIIDKLLSLTYWCVTGGRHWYLLIDTITILKALHRGNTFFNSFLLMRICQHYFIIITSALRLHKGLVRVWNGFRTWQKIQSLIILIPSHTRPPKTTLDSYLNLLLLATENEHSKQGKHIYPLPSPIKTWIWIKYEELNK